MLKQARVPWMPATFGGVGFRQAEERLGRRACHVHRMRVCAIRPMTIARRYAFASGSAASGLRPKGGHAQHCDRCRDCRRGALPRTRRPDTYYPRAAAEFFLSPLVELLRRTWLERILSLAVAVILANGVILSLASVFGSELAQLATQTQQYETTIEGKINNVRDVTVGRYGRSSKDSAAI